MKKIISLLKNITKPLFPKFHKEKLLSPSLKYSSKESIKNEVFSTIIEFLNLRCLGLGYISNTYKHFEDNNNNHVKLFGDVNYLINTGNFGEIHQNANFSDFYLSNEEIDIIIINLLTKYKLNHEKWIYYDKEKARNELKFVKVNDICTFLEEIKQKI